MGYINGGRTGLLGAPTYAMLRDATLTTLLSILAEAEIPYELNKSEFVLSLKDTRSRILLRSLDEYERLRGTNLAWFGIDELSYVQEDAWTRLEARLRDPKATMLSGFAVWTPKGFDWIYQRFIGTPITGYEVIRAQPMENRHLLDKVPDYYDRLRSSYDDVFYRQEVLGEYLSSAGGLVYREFSRLDHVKPCSVDPNLPLGWALDFNVDPMCSVVVQVRGEQTYVLDEIVIPRASTADACQEFMHRFADHRAGLELFGDASGRNAKTSGDSDYRVIERYFASTKYAKARVQVPKANPPVRERIEIVNARLRNANGDVRIVISPKCKELIKDFEQVQYKSDTCLIDKHSDSKRTHLSDALGYLIATKFRERPAAGDQMNRLL